MEKVIHKGTRKNLYIIMGLLLLLAYGFFLRVYKVDEQSYWIDEGYTLNAVISTLEKGYPILDSGESYSRSILNTYLIAGAVKLGGMNPLSTRSVAIIFGLGTILVVYFLGKRFFNEWVGLGAAAFTTLSYWEIAWSRQARMYSQLQFFYLLSLYIFFSLLEKFSYKKLFLLSILTLATILSHFFGFFLLALYAVIFIIKIVRKDNQKIVDFFRKHKKNFLIGLIILAIVVPIIGALGYQVFTRILARSHFVGDSYLKFILTSLPIISVSAVIGLVVFLLQKKKTLQALLLGLAYIIPYLSITFSTDIKHFRYLFFVLPILFILSSYLFYELSKLFNARATTYLFNGLIGVTIIASMIFSPTSFNLMPRSDYYLEPKTPQPNFAYVYDIIKTRGFSENDVIISPYTQMDKIYLGKSDYWLAIDLLGKNLDKETVPEREFYNNALTIKNAEQLKEITKNNSGYLVVDDMARVRLDEEINKTIILLPIIYYELKENGNSIWVFSF